MYNIIVQYYCTILLYNIIVHYNEYRCFLYKNACLNIIQIILYLPKQFKMVSDFVILDRPLLFYINMIYTTSQYIYWNKIIIIINIYIYIIINYN